MKNSHTQHHEHDVFEQVELFIEKFDGSERDAWQKPEEVIVSFNLIPSATVVEIGAGTGYFAVRIAPHVRDGKVICIEQSAKMAEYLEKRARDLGLLNIDTRRTKPGGSFELDEQADLIFSVDVYHHLPDRVAYFSHLRDCLKPGGVIAILDRTEERVAGQPHGHRVPKEKVIEEMHEAGFELASDFDFLLPVQYYLTFKRAQKHNEKEY